MTTVYRIRRNDGEFGPELKRKEMLERLKARLTKIGGPFILDGKGPISIGKVMRRMRWQTRFAKKGTVWIIAQPPTPGSVTLRVRAFEAAVVIENPPWAPQYYPGTVAGIQEVAREAYAFDSGVDCLGSKVCKNISGTSDWSQHAYGKAIDLAFQIPPPVGFDMARQDKLYDHLVMKRSELGIAQIIHRDHEWTYYSGFRPYTGVYHTHVHVSVLTWGEGHPSGC